RLETCPLDREESRAFGENSGRVTDVARRAGGYADFLDRDDLGGVAGDNDHGVTGRAPDADRRRVGADLVGVQVAPLAHQAGYRAEPPLHEAQQAVVLLRLVLNKVVLLYLQLRI